MKRWAQPECLTYWANESHVLAGAVPDSAKLAGLSKRTLLELAPSPNLTANGLETAPAKIALPCQSLGDTDCYPRASPRSRGTHYTFNELGSVLYRALALRTASLRRRPVDVWFTASQTNLQPALSSCTQKRRLFRRGLSSWPPLSAPRLSPVQQRTEASTKSAEPAVAPFAVEGPCVRGCEARDSRTAAVAERGQAVGSRRGAHAFAG